VLNGASRNWIWRWTRRRGSIRLEDFSKRWRTHIVANSLNTLPSGIVGAKGPQTRRSDLNIFLRLLALL
jgi:hypothetical protein